MKARRRDDRPPKPKAVAPSLDDILAQERYAACAKEMAKWLKGSVLLSRSIGSINGEEMTLLAIVAITHWIMLASHRLPAASEEERAMLQDILS